MAQRRQQRVQRLIVSGARPSDTIRKAVVFNARAAARKATAFAGQGYQVAVETQDGLVKMTCKPVYRGGGRRNAAKCEIEPMFKKQIKGLAGLAGTRRRRRR